MRSKIIRGLWLPKFSVICSLSFLIFGVFIPKLLAEEKVPRISRSQPWAGTTFWQNPGGRMGNVVTVADSCRNYSHTLVAFVVLGCPDSSDALAARLRELVPLLRQSYEVLRVAPMRPGEPAPPVDGLRRVAVLAPEVVRRHQMEGLERMIAAVDQAIAERRSASRHRRNGSRSTNSQQRPSNSAQPSAAVPLEQIIQGVGGLVTIIRSEVMANPNAQQQALLNNSGAVLRDLEVIIPQLTEASELARRNDSRLADCLRTQRRAQQAADERARIENQRQAELEMQEYVDCRRHRAQQARDPNVVETDESEVMLMGVPESERDRYREMLRGVGQTTERGPIPTTVKDTQPVTPEVSPVE